MATKSFIIAGVLVFYIALSLFLTYAGFTFSGLAGFNFSAEDLPNINSTVGNITIGGFFSILLGIFTFSILGIPFIMNIILWLPLVLMIVIIYEMIRGYG